MVYRHPLSSIQHPLEDPGMFLFMFFLLVDTPFVYFASDPLQGMHLIRAQVISGNLSVLSGDLRSKLKGGSGGSPGPGGRKGQL